MSDYEEYRCTTCGSIGVFPKAIREMWGVTQEYLSGIFICKECEDRFQREYAEKARKEAEEKYSNILLSDFPIPLENRGNRFSNFIVTDKRMQKPFDAVKAFVNDDLLIIALIGKNGNGKTHLAVSWLYDAVNSHKGKKPCYCTEQQICSDIVDTISEKTAVSKVVRKYSEYDYLVIDELGKSKATEFTQQAFQQIITNRLDSHRKTILCGNWDAKTMDENINDANISRMSSSGRRFVFAYEDYRRNRRTV